MLQFPSAFHSKPLSTKELLTFALIINTRGNKFARTELSEFFVWEFTYPEKKNFQCRLQGLERTLADGSRIGQGCYRQRSEEVSGPNSKLKQKYPLFIHLYELCFVDRKTPDQVCVYDKGKSKKGCFSFLKSEE